MSDDRIPLPTRDELDRLMTSATPKPRAGEVCDVCGGRKSACDVLGHRPPGDKTQWQENPRAGERTPMTTKLIDEMLHGAGIPRCDEWDKLVRHSRALEASVYRGISDIERVEAERDLLKERERELERLLGDVLQYGGLYPSSSLFTRISAALAKARP